MDAVLIGLIFWAVILIGVRQQRLAKKATVGARPSTRPAVTARTTTVRGTAVPRNKKLTRDWEQDEPWSLDINYEGEDDL